MRSLHSVSQMNPKGWECAGTQASLKGGSKTGLDLTLPTPDPGTSTVRRNICRVRQSWKQGVLVEILTKRRFLLNLIENKFSIWNSHVFQTTVSTSWLLSEYHILVCNIFQNLLSFCPIYFVLQNLVSDRGGQLLNEWSFCLPTLEMMYNAQNLSEGREGSSMAEHYLWDY